MKKLSIIVPVYNVEAYVAKCLDSICGEQDIPSSMYEVIVVNDGSTDNSRHIVGELMAKYDNIVVKDRPNGGLSAARNTGMELAQGEYIMFVDSDDYIEKNRLGPIVDLLEAHQPEILSFRHTSFYEDGSSADPKVLHFTGEHSVFTGLDFFACRDLWKAMVWLYIYRRDFLRDHSLTFVEGIIHEDEEFSPRAVCEANKVIYWDSAVYRYLRRNGSIMRNPKQISHRIHSLEQVILSLQNFASNHTMPSQVKSTLGNRLEDFSITIQLLCIKQGDHQALNRQIHFLKRNHLYPISSREWQFGIKASIRSKLRQIKIGVRVLKMRLLAK